MKTKSIIDFVGNTPLVEAQNIFQKEGVTLLLKLEGNNPGGSVKDRAAFNMISEALRRKNIRKGTAHSRSNNCGSKKSYPVYPTQLIIDLLFNWRSCFNNCQNPCFHL